VCAVEVVALQFLIFSKDEKAAERKKRRIEKEEAAKIKLQSVKDERAPHHCQTCGTGYKRLGSAGGHFCTPFADADNNDKVAFTQLRLRFEGSFR
jgi:hypothetical protein